MGYYSTKKQQNKQSHKKEIEEQLSLFLEQHSIDKCNYKYYVASINVDGCPIYYFKHNSFHPLRLRNVIDLPQIILGNKELTLYLRSYYKNNKNVELVVIKKFYNEEDAVNLLNELIHSSNTTQILNDII